MLGRIFRNSFFRMPKNLPRRQLGSFSKIAAPHRLFFTTHGALLTKDFVQNIDLNLQDASDVGESAVIDLMEILKENILYVCKAYKECLRKQIEIIEEASASGPLSKRWDDLPEYRSLAVELSQELSNFTTAINTIGQMVEDDTMQFITQQASHLNAIALKYKELQAVLTKQMEEINSLEAKVLEVKKKSILDAR